MSSADEVDFNRDIRPILSDKCFACHGPDAEHREADLRLDLQEGATADLGGYRAVVPGDLAASELIHRIESTDNDLRMPPAESGKDLKPEEIALLRQWIESGAAWSPPWATVPPVRHEVPAVRQKDWPLNWIDNFILARLESEGITPSVEADRVTLCRRLYFDLIGLPPTPKQVEDFLADTSPDAYERLVDELLASPHFGERMAIYWLDLVRFADTVGYHGDQTHNVWPYRDYVIEAFNSNKPFDVFTREQLAGDLLPNATIDQKIATAYNRLLQTSHEGGVQLKEYRAIYMADRVRNVSQVWMGATMGCCQCHDHKFDPLSAREFYELGAFFADVDDEHHLVNQGNLNSLPSPRVPQIGVLSCLQRKQIAQWQAEIDQLDEQHDEGVINGLKQKISAVEQAKSDCMVTQSAEPRTVRLLPRGNWLDESGPVVQPKVPECFGHIDKQERATRLDLANWLTSETDAGGLTSRVMVNRFWYLFFGSGIAGVLDDFGGQGEPPVHPELLDNLALEFLNNGWDVKRFVKLLVMSRCYRQSSDERPELLQRDPGNRLVARQTSYRLPAEMVRDAALSVSGLLVDDIGGPSVKPYQPVGLYRHLNFPKRKYQADQNQQQWHRGLYVHWQRQFLHPQLKAFDATTREECTAQRPRSNTPLAALVLLNDPTFVEAARNLAESVMPLAETDPSSAIEQIFRRAVSRGPDSEEKLMLMSLLQSQQEYYQEHPDSADKLLGIGISEYSPSYSKTALAAWTAVGRAVLNLHETLSRN